MLFNLYRFAEARTMYLKGLEVLKGLENILKEGLRETEVAMRGIHITIILMKLSCFTFNLIFKSLQ